MCFSQRVAVCLVSSSVLLVALYGPMVKSRKCADPKAYKITRVRPETVQLGPKMSSDPFPCKLADLARTSRTNLTAPKDVTVPRWTLHFGQMTYNTPLIDGSGNIYLVTTLGEVFSADPNGEKRWSMMIRDQPANPAMEDGVLFVSDASGLAWAIDTATGQPRWVERIGHKGSPGNYGITLGHGIAIFHADLGIPPGQSVAHSDFIAMESATGKELWRNRVNADFFNVIPSFADGGTSLVYTDMDGGTVKLETKTGKTIWTRQGYPWPMPHPEGKFTSGPGGAPRTHSGLALIGDGPAEGLVFTAGNPTPATGRVKALRLDDGTEVWSREIDKMMGNNGAYAVIDGIPTLVVGAGVTAMHPIPESRPPFFGTVHAFHAVTGDPLWLFDADAHNQWVAAGSIILPGCIDMNLPDAFSSPTVDARGTVYIGWHGGYLYALDGRNGRLISKYNTEEGIQGQPAIGPSGELIVIAGRTLYSFWH